MNSGVFILARGYHTASLACFDCCNGVIFSVTAKMVILGLQNKEKERKKERVGPVFEGVLNKNVLLLIMYLIIKKD